MVQSIETPEAAASPVDQIDVVLDPLSPEWQQGEQVEASVFMEKDYVTGAGELAAEYAPYVAHTEFVVIKRDGELAGSTRVIHYSPDAGFKTLTDIHQGRLQISETGRKILESLDLSKTFEVGTLAVTPEMRARPENEGRVAVSLYAALYAEALHHQTPYVLASFDEDYFNRFKGIFGPGVQELGPATNYMGSPTVPVLMDTETLVQHLEQNFPEMRAVIEDMAAQVVHN